MRTFTRAALTAATTLTLALATTACTSDSGDAAPSGSTGTTGADTTGTAAGVELSDGWARATDTDMSAVFGTLRNNGSDDAHLTGISSELEGSHELHEMVPGGGSMMMQENPDGIVIPAGGEYALEPGGDHIMLMELTDPITTGQQIILTLEFADGSEQEITISARDFEGGEENYAPADHGDMGHGGTDHGDMDHDG